MLHDWLIISSSLLICICMMNAVMLWLLKKQNKSKAILSIIFVLLSIWALISLIKSYEPIELLDFSYCIFSLSLLPLVSLYLMSLMHPSAKHKKSLILWGISLCIYLIIYIFLYISDYPQVHLYSLQDILSNSYNLLIWLRTIVFLHYIIGLFWICYHILKTYKQHRYDIAQQFSYSENISLSWLPYLLGVFIVVGIGTCFDLFWVESDNTLSYIISNAGYSLFYLVYGFLGVLQQDIYQNKQEEPDDLAEKNHSGKNQSVHIPLSIRVQLQTGLKILLEEKKVYLNPDLKLDTMASALQTNRTYLSWVIKEDFGENFIGLINRYRIEEAKALLKNPDTLTGIDDISEKVGFKSISSFNLFFKRYTNQTPAAFRKIMMNEKQR